MPKSKTRSNQENGEKENETSENKNSCENCERLQKKVDRLEGNMKTFKACEREKRDKAQGKLRVLAEENDFIKEKCNRLQGELDSLPNTPIPEERADDQLMKSSDDDIETGVKQGPKKDDLSPTTSKLKELREILLRIQGEKSDKERELENKSNELGSMTEIANQTERKVTELKNILSQKEKEVDELRAERERMERNIEKLNQEKSALQERLNTTLTGKERTRMNDHAVVIERLRTENSDLVLRLSRFASKRLTEGNPAIADLSDQKRPTKLAEMFSELYDNEWTEAFEEQQNLGRKEEDAIFTLLQLTLEIHEECQTVSPQYLKDIMDSASSCVIKHQKMNVKIDKDNDDLLEVRRLSKEIRDIMTPYLRERVHSELKKFSKRNSIKGKKMGMFVKRCLEICWNMSVKDPPVMLMQLPVEGSKVDTNNFRFYTKSGPHVDFVVWPALLLHAEGTTLSKGIVQGRSENSSGK